MQFSKINEQKCFGPASYLATRKKQTFRITNPNKDHEKFVDSEKNPVPEFATSNLLEPTTHVTAHKSPKSAIPSAHPKLLSPGPLFSFPRTRARTRDRENN